MRVLIVDPDLSGHHAPYLRHLLCSLTDLKQELVVVTSVGASQMPQFGIHLQDVSSSVTWDESLAAAQRPSYRYVSQLFANLRAALERHRPEHVWIPYCDPWTAYLGLRALIARKVRWPAGVEIEGLLFRGQFAYTPVRWDKWLPHLLSRLLVPRANWDILHFLDPIPFETLRRAHPDRSDRIRLMPDPVESVPLVEPSLARSRLRIPVDGRFVSAIGVHFEGAGIESLLRAFREARLDETNRLLLAGPMTEAVRHHFEDGYADLLRAGRIVTINRHLNLEEVALAVMASDLVCVPRHRRIGSSSFVIRAAAAGRPVLTDDFGWTGWAVRRFGLGWTTDVHDTQKFADALRDALERTATISVSQSAERFARYHSAENFKAHWTARLRERLSLPADPNLISWQWVLDEQGSAHPSLIDEYRYRRNG